MSHAEQGRILQPPPLCTAMLGSWASVHLARPITWISRQAGCRFSVALVLLNSSRCLPGVLLPFQDPVLQHPWADQTMVAQR